MRVNKRIACIVMILGGVLFLVSSASWAGPEPVEPTRKKIEYYDYIYLYGGVWDTTGKASGKISFPDGTSRLEFDDIDSTMYLIGASIKPYVNFITFDFKYAAGDIDYGNGTATDWELGTLWSESKFDIDGDAEYWAVDLYLPLYPWIWEGIGRPTQRGKAKKPQDHLVKLEFLLGWFHYEDRLDMSNLCQTQDPFGIIGGTGPIPGLYSHYDFEWEGLKTGLRYEWDMVKNPSDYIYSFGLKAEAAFLFNVRYDGEGIWNLRSDFQQDPSFRHKARNGDGTEWMASLFYGPMKHFLIELGYRCIDISADGGKDTTYFSGGAVGQYTLDGVDARRRGPFLLLSAYF